MPLLTERKGLSLSMFVLMIVLGIGIIVGIILFTISDSLDTIFMIISGSLLAIFALVFFLDKRQQKIADQQTQEMQAERPEKLRNILQRSGEKIPLEKLAKLLKFSNTFDSETIRQYLVKRFSEQGEEYARLINESRKKQQLSLPETPLLLNMLAAEMKPHTKNKQDLDNFFAQKYAFSRFKT